MELIFNSVGFSESSENSDFCVVIYVNFLEKMLLNQKYRGFEC